MRDQRHTTDESGNTWLTDKDGNIVTDASGNRIPGPAQRLTSSSGFTHYDTAQGHCGLRESHLPRKLLPLTFKG